MTKAVRDRRALDLEREKDYRNADNGYNRSFGDKNRYRDIFRNGFADGYRSAYNRYGYNAGYSGGPYYGGRAEPRRDSGLGYPGYPGSNRGYRTGSGYSAKLRVPERCERRLSEGSRRRAAMESIPTTRGRNGIARATATTTTGMGRGRRTGSGTEADSARIRARVSRARTSVIAQIPRARQPAEVPNRRNFFIRASKVFVSTVTAPAVAVLMRSRSARRATAARRSARSHEGSPPRGAGRAPLQSR